MVRDNEPMARAARTMVTMRERFAVSPVLLLRVASRREAPGRRGNHENERERSAPSQTKSASRCPLKRAAFPCVNSPGFSFSRCPRSSHGAAGSTLLENERSTNVRRSPTASQSKYFPGVPQSIDPRSLTVPDAILNSFTRKWGNRFANWAPESRGSADARITWPLLFPREQKASSNMQTRRKPPAF